MWKHSYICQNWRDSTMLLLLVITLTHVGGDNMKKPPLQIPHSDDTPALHELRRFSVGDGKFIDIASQIAGRDYTKFGQLILEDGNEVRIIENDYYRDSKGIVVEIFHHWLNGNGRQPTTWSTLVECLQDSDLNALADCINSVITSTLTPDSWQCDLEAMDIQQPILEYGKVLKNTYEMQSVTDPGHWLQISMPFINLTLNEGDNTGKRLHGSNNLSLDEIANSITDGSKVLMSGRPGVGKTTLLRHIAKEWAEGHFLQKFSLVLLFQLGHIPSSKITDLEDMLQYISPNHNTASVARELGRTGGKGICFLLDALDEYTPQIPKDHDYIYRLIKGAVSLPNASMIVTSSENDLIERLYFTRKIIVFGFSECQVEQYINALAPYDAKLSQYLHFHTNIKDVCYLPLHLAMVTYLANQSEENSLGRHLDTDTRIYHMFVNLTFRCRYREEEDFNGIHFQAFSAISKVSFQSIPSGFDSVIPFVHGLRSLNHHILNWKGRTGSFDILSKNSWREGSDIVESFSFSHHTFQYFFAAHHLTTLPYKEQIEIMESSVFPFYPYLMWKFFFGLLRDHSPENSTKVFQNFSIIATEHYRDDYVILSCAYELKQPAIADILARSLNYSIILKRYALQHPSDCAAIGYAISLNPLQFKRLAIKYAVFDSEQWEACFDSIRDQLPQNNTNEVAHVTLDRLKLSDRTASAAMKLLQHFPNLQQLELLDVLTNSSILTAATELEGLKHLRHLEISSFDTMSETIAALSGTLTSLNRLEHLGLSGLRIDVVVIHKNLDLSDLSRNPPLLQKLNLTQNEIGDDEIEALAELIKHLTSLEELDLSWNAIGDRGIAKLAEETENLKSLEALDLSDNRIGDEGAAKLAQSLKNLTSLRVLKLHSNAIGNDGTVALAERMKHLTSLEELDLSNNTIGNLGAAKLAKETKHLSSLRRLDLDGNKISDEGHKRLLEAVKTGWSGLETLTVGSNTTYSNNDLVGIRSQNATEPVNVILVVLNYIMLGVLWPVIGISAVLLFYYVTLVLLRAVNIIPSVLYYVMSGLLYCVKLVLVWAVNVIPSVLYYVISGLLYCVMLVLLYVLCYYVMLVLLWLVYVILVVLYYVMFGLLVYVTLVLLFYVSYSILC